jgi:ribulose-phosphate 3-epimerase
LVTAPNHREQTRARLQAATPAIAPSILLCDYAHLAREIERLEEAGARLLHLDVMDGHFVPNFTFGMTIVEAARRCTELPLDVHLMMERPDKYVRQFREAGADVITVHEEVCRDQSELADLVATIRELDALAGIAINPPTPLEKIDRVASDCDLILCMSVMPGFGGQSFDRVALEKLSTLRDRPDVDAFLEVDGGVNLETIGECTAAGANLLVVGSAISSGNSYRERFAELATRIK